MNNFDLSKTIKYLLVVVEGGSDRTTFENALRNLLLSYSDNKNLEIDVVKGDAFVFDDDGKLIAFNQEEENVSKQISKKILDLKLRPTDIFAIAMITDLDACFADDNFFVEDDKCKKVNYDFDNKICKRLNIEELKSYRKAKFNIVKKMRKKSHINIDGYQIKYRLFYFNVDLEWVFYHKLNCSKQEKIDLSNDFDLKYGDNIKEFVDFINSLPCIGDSLEESWEAIDTASILPFDVYTNIKYLIEWIKELSKE